ncbi:hypothetical protein VRK_28760 [Vibrio sp. MEBiC08052]|nr:hypothetical protein VRK_28760 [Vibrio sp. MEBiC08052]
MKTGFQISTKNKNEGVSHNLFIIHEMFLFINYDGLTNMKKQKKQ